MTKTIATALFAAAAALFTVGCNSPNNIDKVTIRDTAPSTGQTRILTCRTCGEHSDCANTNKGFAWAVDHSKSRGHYDFNRDNCVDTLKN
jgi:hypothetical protein